ncbi:DUF4097 family beta strand repeat-containing protein [Nonomuraea sp. NPDC049714]|jgi:hypothetical protein|uniref:DUF4097 family beta strand repeat-containing protein n=1 Tax=Nonomuraea sp. NPDC049714 TaxID=3364357 RepID=UPI0037B191DF
MRAAWLIAGSVMTVLALLMSTVALSRGMAMAQAPSEHTTRTIPFPGNSQLRIEANGGHVRLDIHAGEAGMIVVDRELQWSQAKPSVSEDWNGRTLRLDTSCVQEWLQEEHCEVDYRLFVPQETDIEVVSSTSPVGVDRVHGDVRVTSVSGDVRVYDIPGPLRVRSGSGAVRANDLFADQADVEVGSGHVDLEFRTAPSRVRAVVRTSGDIDLHLPDAPYDVSANAPQVSVSTDHTATSPRKITVSTPEGTVDICC